MESLTEQEHRTDAELIEAANAGESTAFELLYFRYRDWVVNLAFRFTADRDLALDILQETFLYFAKKCPGFTLTCQLRSFLYPVVKNLSLNARQKAGRYVLDEELFAQIENPARDLHSGDEELRLAISKLPLAQREVVLLRFMEEMSLAEIAEAMEIPLGTVKSRLHNALEELRRNAALKSLFE